MYEIIATVDGKDYTLHNVNSSRLVVGGNPYYEIGDNVNGMAEFDVYPGHPYFHLIRKMTTDIIFKNNDKEVFWGRVVWDKENLQGVKHVFVEGELGYLCDSIQRPHAYHNITVNDYFTSIINNHNAQVEQNKRFTVGRVTVTDPNDSLYRFSNYETTREILSEKLVKRLGGHIVVRHENGTRYIDYLADGDFYSRCMQEIEFGKNLLSFARNFDASDIATCIIPLGAKLEQSTIKGLDERVTISSVNNGIDYVTDDAAVKEYGKIYKTVVFDNVTLPANLMDKGKKYLTTTQYEKLVLECKAIDLSLTDAQIESFKVGSEVRCLSKFHALDAWYPVTKLRQYISDPKKNTITLGHEGSNNSYTSSNRQESADFKEEIEEHRTTLQEKIEQAKNDFTDGMNKAGGLYYTEVTDPTGKTIRYLHNNKVLESSSIRIVINDNGIAVSNDAGKNWYGMKVDGKMIAKELYAEGINANYINAGIIKDALGKNFWNLATGEFRISSTTLIEDKPITELLESFKLDFDMNHPIFQHYDPNPKKYDPDYTIDNLVIKPVPEFCGKTVTCTYVWKRIENGVESNLASGEVVNAAGHLVVSHNLESRNIVFKCYATYNDGKNNHVTSKTVEFNNINEGLNGSVGVPGAPGSDGKTTYFHIKYSKNPNGNPMSEIPDKYIGTCVDFNVDDPIDYAMYTWSKFEGQDGANGIPGTNGVDGKTSYLHIAYANSENGSVGFSTTDSYDKAYIGQYTDFILQDSLNYRDYKWSKIKGRDGIDGIDGTNGKDAAVQSPTEPADKTQLWLDTSYDPPLLKQWNGNEWVIVNDSSGQVSSLRTELKKEIYDTNEGFKSEVSLNYYKKGETEELVGTVGSTLEQVRSGFVMRFEGVEGDVKDLEKSTNGKFNKIEEYIRFLNGNIEMGALGSPFKRVLSRTRDSYFENDVEIAYFGNRKLYVKDGEFINSCQIGDFGFIPETNGSLSFRKVRWK